ncbi:hypothetical protein A5741_14390 [Mycolicibacterium conceptionense]|nr:hypothetical protein A5639_18780 [Mycolicibacterium conceptionense]OMB88971.1 hypothetical protein A5741_14390 [Mycolicibacterium conceptionense]
MEVFNFAQVGANVRTLEIDGEPWFVAKDVCAVLGYNHTPSAIRRLDEDEYAQFTPNVRRSGPPQRPMTIVSESGLYSLILWSRKPEAEAFKNWVCDVVLPTIRKTGAFFTQKAAMSLEELYRTDPDAALARLVEIAQVAQEARAKLNDGANMQVSANVRPNAIER